MNIRPFCPRARFILSDDQTALGFQILHILYSAERFLERLKNQSSNFEVIFFESSFNFLPALLVLHLDIPHSKYPGEQPFTSGECHLFRLQFSVSREQDRDSTPQGNRDPYPPL